MIAVSYIMFIGHADAPQNLGKENAKHTNERLLALPTPGEDGHTERQCGGQLGSMH